MLKIKSILIVAVACFAAVAWAGDNLTIVVAGSKTGTLTLAANMLANDSKNNLLNSASVTLIEPGNACRGFAEAVSRQTKDTFLVPIENLYSENALIKNDPLCPVPDIKQATPVFTEVQALYLVSRSGVSVEYLKTQPMPVGYSSDGHLEKRWHESLNRAFGQPHRYIGYSGSGNLINGMLAGDVDVAWITWTGYTRLIKAAPGAFVVHAASAQEKTKNVPLVSTLLGNPGLTRGFVITWWLFNDRNGQAGKLSSNLENLAVTGSGEWGRWSLDNKKEFLFDRQQQQQTIGSHSWNK